MDHFDHLELGGLDDLYLPKESTDVSAFGERAFDDDIFFHETGQEGVDPRKARKIEVARIAQANRDAASHEERELASRLRVTPIPNFDHPHTSSSHKSSCIGCAKGVVGFYEQNGSNIDFAMIDSRWPRFICKHLKASYRCIECDGVSLCLHGRERFRCPTCGNGMCHDPMHEKYRKFKPLRKNKCPGCKEAKMATLDIISKGGSSKRKYFSKIKRYSMKKRHLSMKRRHLSMKRRHLSMKRRHSSKKGN
jgi:hypothetical protein